MSGRRLGIVALAVAVTIGLATTVGLVGPGSDSERPPAAGGGVPSDALRARVASHIDGDTIRLVGKSRSALLPRGVDTTVRLLEIDTPEHERDGAAAECYAAVASQALRDMLPAGAEVWVTRDQELRDPYGRTLLYLWTADGDFVNIELVRRGFARAVLFDPNDEYIDEMHRAESQARSDGRGLWGAC